MKHSEIPKHLKAADVDAFSIFREKKGEKFTYLNKSGKPISSSTLNLVSSYGVPNTWTQVSLSADGKAHILAAGYDGSNKLQYLYHPDYLEYRNSLKFLELSEFGKLLPRIRRRVNKDLKQAEWCEEKLLALVVKILDKHHLRIGSRAYAKKNSSFGLTTLRKKHLQETDNGLSFQFTGKSGQQRSVELNNPDLIEFVKECVDFPGWEIFSFKHKNSSCVATSDMVNSYIRKISRSDFSARTFRTWGGTSLAVKLRAKAQKIIEQNKRKELEATLVQLVAEHLGNTPSICKQYYIHPQVLTTVTKKGYQEARIKSRFKNLSYLNKHEKKTLSILKPS